MSYKVRAGSGPVNVTAVIGGVVTEALYKSEEKAQTTKELNHEGHEGATKDGKTLLLSFVLLRVLRGSGFLEIAPVASSGSPLLLLAI